MRKHIVIYRLETKTGNYWICPLDEESYESGLEVFARDCHEEIVENIAEIYDRDEFTEEQILEFTIEECWEYFSDEVVKCYNWQLELCETLEYDITI